MKENGLMISEFDWCGCKAITDKQKRVIESSIRQTFEAQGDVELKSCQFTGNSDASNVTFERIN